MSTPAAAAPATTGSASEERAPFLDGFAGIHQAMREDAARLPGAVADADDARARALVRWFGRFHITLVHHHTREDELLWPELIRRSPDFTAEMTVLAEDHHQLDASLDRTATALAALAATTASESARAEAVAATTELAAILTEHLAREEAAAFGRFSRLFTAEEYEALEEQIRKGAGVGQLAFEAPWVLDRMASERQAELLADAPAALRLLYRFVFLRRYHRLAAAAFGAPAVS